MQKIIASNGYIGIIAINHGICTQVTYLDYDGKTVRRAAIYEDIIGFGPYFKVHGEKLYLRDFIRTDF